MISVSGNMISFWPKRWCPNTWQMYPGVFTLSLKAMLSQKLLGDISTGQFNPSNHQTRNSMGFHPLILLQFSFHNSVNSCSYILNNGVSFPLILSNGSSCELYVYIYGVTIILLSTLSIWLNIIPLVTFTFCNFPL